MVIKEFFEKHKNKITYIIIGLLVLSNVFTGVKYFINIRRADNEINDVRAELINARNSVAEYRKEIGRIRVELSEERGRLTKCRNEVQTIRSGLADDNNELRGIIEKLQFVAKEVAHMEDILYNDSSSSFNRNRSE